MNNEALNCELNDILDYWAYTVFNEETGLFIGRIDNEGNKYLDASLGAVLYTRIIWSFSAGYATTLNLVYRERALQAYVVLKEYFFDIENGGIYWEVSSNGEPLNCRKQVYAQAFCIYALSELYKIEPDGRILQEALSLFHLIETHSFDEEEGGYLEAFNEDWSPIMDMRLSNKDMNAPKTMNTHLHILEAYSNLYSVHEDVQIKEKIVYLLVVFSSRIIDPKTKHLQSFFDRKWNSLSSVKSYGHDIEASWLLVEAARKVYSKNKVPAYVYEMCEQLALKAMDGLLADGSLADGASDDGIEKERHWWAQAEAMVGFYSIGLLTSDLRFFKLVELLWDYIQKEMKDGDNGEWFWGRDEYGNIMHDMDKVGMWKCPYHNSRACIELLRLNAQNKYMDKNVLK